MWGRLESPPHKTLNYLQSTVFPPVPAPAREIAITGLSVLLPEPGRITNSTLGRDCLSVLGSKIILQPLPVVIYMPDSNQVREGFRRPWASSVAASNP